MWSVKCRFWTPESSLSFIWGHFCRGHRGRPLLRAFTIQSSLTVAVSWCCIKKKFELCFSCVVVFSSVFFRPTPSSLELLSNFERSPTPGGVPAVRRLRCRHTKKKLWLVESAYWFLFSCLQVLFLLWGPIRKKLCPDPLTSSSTSENR